MKYRKLRIAWSVTWAMAAVLICVLWVRSYFVFTKVWFGTKQSAVISEVLRGSAQIQYCLTRGVLPGARYAILVEPIPNDENYTGGRQWGFAGFGLAINAPDEFDPLGSYSLVVCPCWFLAILLAAISVMPWLKLPHRFSLRTLLIATTLIALLLGAIICVMK